MNDWKVVYTEQAEQDLRGIYEYIALLEPEIAKNQTRRIMDTVAKLNQMLLRYHLYDKEPWHSKGIRVLPVDNFLAFYLPVKAQETVVVIRIMYGGRNIEEQLGQTEMDTGLYNRQDHHHPHPRRAPSSQRRLCWCWMSPPMAWTSGKYPPTVEGEKQTS